MKRPSHKVERHRPDSYSDYGWSDDGKTPAEISSDIMQTRYRLDADLRALRSRFLPPLLTQVATAVGVALIGYVVRRLSKARR